MLDLERLNIDAEASFEDVNSHGRLPTRRLQHPAGGNGGG